MKYLPCFLAWPLMIPLGLVLCLNIVAESLVALQKAALDSFAHSANVFLSPMLEWSVTHLFPKDQ